MKKHKTKIIIGAVIAVALVVTFLMGGDMPGTNSVNPAQIAHDTSSVTYENIVGGDTEATNLPDGHMPMEAAPIAASAYAEAVENDEASSESARTAEGSEFADEQESETAAKLASAQGLEPVSAEVSDITEQAQVSQRSELEGGQSEPVASQPQPSGSNASEASESGQEGASPAEPQSEPALPVSNPERPAPVEPQDVVITDNSFTVYLTIRVDTLLNNMHRLNREKHELVPADGVIFPLTAVTAYEGESVFNVLQRETRRNRIHMESRFTPIFNSAYIMGIHNLYEFDAGELSGWMYKVNGWFPNFGASRYILSPGDVIEWHFTVDLGRDLGETWLGGAQQTDQ